MLTIKIRLTFERNFFFTYFVWIRIQSKWSPDPANPVLQGLDYNFLPHFRTEFVQNLDIMLSWTVTRSIEYLAIYFSWFLHIASQSMACDFSCVYAHVHLVNIFVQILRQTRRDLYLLCIHFTWDGSAKFFGKITWRHSVIKEFGGLIVFRAIAGIILVTSYSREIYSQLKSLL